MSVIRVMSVSLLLLAAACGEREAKAPEEPKAPAPEADIDEGPTVTLAPLYIGVWAAEEDWCGVEPGSADPSPIEFTEDELIGYENRCSIESVEEGTEGGYQLVLSCTGEGVTSSETAEVDVDGDTLSMRRNGGEATTFVRCRYGEDMIRTE